MAADTTHRKAVPALRLDGTIMNRRNRIGEKNGFDQMYHSDRAPCAVQHHATLRTRSRYLGVKSVQFQSSQAMKVLGSKEMGMIEPVLASSAGIVDSLKNTTSRYSLLSVPVIGKQHGHAERANLSTPQ